MRRYVGVIGVLAVLTAGCAASVNVGQEQAALMAQDKAWSQTTTDLDKFLSYYAADASVYPPEMPIATGTAAIRATFSAIASTPGFVLHWTATKAAVGAAGDLGYTAGTYDMTMNNAAGKPQTERGKYLTVWKKQADGQWKAIEDILNSDAPPPPPSAPKPAASKTPKTTTPKTAKKK